MRNLTKESRITSRNYQFAKLIEIGYLQETYKELDFFTKEDGKYFTLKVYRGTAANHEEYMNYRTAERRAEVIQNYKTNYESRQAYKAEQKEKNKGKSSSHAGAAAAIKAELKQNFPHIKFSVTSETFANGNSVHINWTDGATTGEVKEFTSKYQYGHFDGMTDMYNNTNDRDDIPQVKYISESRSISEDLTKEIKAQLMTLKTYTAEQLTDYRENPEQHARELLYNVNIPHNYTAVKVTINDTNTTGYFKISFEAPESTQKEAPQYKEVEPTAGEINIIDYSEKAIAVIGDTKPIKDKLKALGGSFNPRLNCGAGWIFPKRKLAEITAALSEEAETTPEPQETTVILATPQTNVFKLDYFKIIWHEGRHIDGATFENATFTNWEDVQKTFVKLWEVNEKGSGGGYTKVKCEIKFTDSEAFINRIDITDKTDNGDFNPSEMHIVTYLQSIADETEETANLLHPEFPANHPLNICDPESAQYKECLNEYLPEQPKKYTNLTEIKQAAQNGKVISLFNLSQLANQ